MRFGRLVATKEVTMVFPTQDISDPTFYDKFAAYLKVKPESVSINLVTEMLQVKVARDFQITSKLPMSQRGSMDFQAFNNLMRINKLFETSHPNNPQAIMASNNLLQILAPYSQNTPALGASPTPQSVPQDIRQIDAEIDALAAQIEKFITTISLIIPQAQQWPSPESVHDEIRMVRNHTDHPLINLYAVWHTGTKCIQNFLEIKSFYASLVEDMVSAMEQLENLHNFMKEKKRHKTLDSLEVAVLTLETKLKIVYKDAMYSLNIMQQQMDMINNRLLFSGSFQHRVSYIVNLINQINSYSKTDRFPTLIYDIVQQQVIISIKTKEELEAYIQKHSKTLLPQFPCRVPDLRYPEGHITISNLKEYYKLMKAYNDFIGLLDDSIRELISIQSRMPEMIKDFSHIADITLVENKGKPPFSS